MMSLKLCILFVLLSAPIFVECAISKKLDWWQTEVFYQIYPRSFKDSDGDGIGDLKGVYSKLEYIKSIGVGALWFSPIFNSPMADFGYDISNFHEVWPTFGTMADLENLVKKAKELGLKVLLDFVPNHTSDEHEWFQKSVKRIPPYDDYYIWKDPKIVNGRRQPPNNWNSVFKGSAWEWSEDRGQYYLHQFVKKQPDLNYRNPVVYEEMKSVIRFWLDKGIDGFRVDAINFAYEHESYHDDPPSYNPKALPNDYEYLNHTYSADQPESLDLVRDWRSILDAYSKDGKTRFMMTETYSNLSYVMQFYGTKNRPASHFPFNFIMIANVHRENNAKYIRDKIMSWYEQKPEGTWANWVIGNHDNPRPATRYGREISDGLSMLQLLLPGTAVVYNGDEFGMEDSYTRWDQTIDPAGLNAGPLRYQLFSRDGCRAPLQWDNSKHAGFTNGSTTWLPVNPNYWQLNVASQLNESSGLTHLKIFKKLTRLRKNIVFQRGDFHLHVITDWVLVLFRSYADHPTYITLVNFGSDDVTCNLRRIRRSLPSRLKIVIPSINSDYHIEQVVNARFIKLRPKASMVLTTSKSYSDGLDDTENVVAINQVDLKDDPFQSDDFLNRNTNVKEVNELDDIEESPIIEAEQINL